VFFPPAAFGQANLDLFERIVEHVHGRIELSAPVVELYCGVGAMGLGLAARGQHVVFNEVAPGSLSGLRLGIEALPSACQVNVGVVAGAAEDRVAQLPLEGAHVLVDPPRSGLHPAVVRALCARRPARLSYLSCGQASFLRDAQELLRAGFRCSGLDAYALFPFTEHVEILAHFESATVVPQGTYAAV
jgi:tRNA/tmRNA/rRNA uracil-C5-methylase (TrmA/RlmC/RlmD family)